MMSQLVKKRTMENEISISLGETTILLAPFAQNNIFGQIHLIKNSLSALNVENWMGRGGDCRYGLAESVRSPQPGLCTKVQPIVLVPHYYLVQKNNTCNFDFN